ncbi:hypothetical protein [Acinetobacter sp.]|jgi:hypothetical protein|uniref:hypothetical protein n=1 Tax=Acinetobacter sp. TaxID=472 RepID=UPI0035B1C1BF
MNALKSAIAVAAFAMSATVSAQIVYIPDFPVKKAAPAQTANASAQAPASEAAAQDQAKAEKAA